MDAIEGNGFDDVGTDVDVIVAWGGCGAAPEMSAEVFVGCGEGIPGVWRG